MPEKRARTYFFLLKILAVTGTIGFTGSVLYATHPQSYFPSLYFVFPTFTWLFWGISAGASTLLIVYSIWANDPAWKYGTTNIVALYFIFFALPRFTGLQFWAPPGGDIFIHFAHISHVIETGHPHSGSLYPLVHQYFAQIQMITGVPVEWTHYITFIISLVFVAGIVLFARRLTGNSQVTLGVLAIGCALVFERFHYPIMPWFMAFALLPLILLALLRAWETGRTAWQAIAIVLITTGTILHPMTGLIVLAVAFLTFATLSLTSVLDSNTSTKGIGISSLLILNAIVYFSYFGWLPAYEDTTRSIVFRMIAGEQGTAELAGSGPTGYTLAQLVWEWVIVEFGVLLLVVGTSGIIGLLLLASMIRYRDISTSGLVMLVIAGSGVVLAIVLIFLPVGTLPPYRSNQVTFVGAILLIGYGLAISLNRTDQSGYRLAATVLVLVVCTATIGAGGLVFSGDEHLIDSEREGIEHAIAYQQPGFDTLVHQLSIKPEVYLRGIEEYDELRFEQLILSNHPSQEPPHRLGYDKNESIGTTLSGPSYIHITERGVTYSDRKYENRLPYLEYYTRGDVDKLSEDEGAFSVYNSGRHAIWIVN